MRAHAFLLLAASVSFSGLLLSGCKTKSSNPEQETPLAAASSGALGSSPELDPKSAEAMRKKTEFLPPPEERERLNNPQGLPVYAGQTGTVRGVVRAIGDPAPGTSANLKDAKSNCTMAHSTFGKLFREGEDRRLADVLIAVTGYAGYVPAKSEVVTSGGVGCAWQSRTIAMTFGQKLDIVAVDRQPYVPELLGQISVAQLFAMPGATPVAVVPRKPGRFTLIDSLRLYNRAEVFVLTYPTATVTKLDGKFEIQGIPVGKVKVNAFLPSTGAVVEANVEIVAGQPVELSFELPFDVTKPLPAPGAQ